MSEFMTNLNNLSWLDKAFLVILILAVIIVVRGLIMFFIGTDKISDKLDKLIDTIERKI